MKMRRAIFMRASLRTDSARFKFPAAAILVLLPVVLGVAAQTSTTKGTPPRTTDGQPDIQGCGTRILERTSVRRSGRPIACRTLPRLSDEWTSNASELLQQLSVWRPDHQLSDRANSEVQTRTFTSSNGSREPIPTRLCMNSSSMIRLYSRNHGKV